MPEAITVGYSEPWGTNVVAYTGLRIFQNKRGGLQAHEDAPDTKAYGLGLSD